MSDEFCWADLGKPAPPTNQELLDSLAYSMGEDREQVAGPNRNPTARRQHARELLGLRVKAEDDGLCVVSVSEYYCAGRRDARWREIARKARR